MPRTPAGIFSKRYMRELLKFCVLSYPKVTQQKLLDSIEYHLKMATFDSLLEEEEWNRVADLIRKGGKV